MNIFQLSYDNRLKNWYDFRNQLTTLDTQQQLVEVDKWWQRAPLVNHYLHPKDTSNWPNPWELLVDNIYCPYARALGMYYTLMLSGIHTIDIVEAIDYNSESVVLVIVDDKYVLNYWPDTVLTNNLNYFTIKQKISTLSLKQKIA